MSEPRSIGPYQIEVKLGRDAFGLVYRARDGGGELVLLKTLVAARDTNDYLERQVSALAQLSHPGLVGVTDAGVERDRFWYTAEWVSAPSLSVLLDSVYHRSEAGSSRRGTDTWWTGALLDEGAPPETGPVESDLWTEDVTGTTKLPDNWHDPYAQPGKPNWQTLLGVAHQLATTLAYLHGEGHVLGQLRPESLLVPESGWARLVDFGLAPPRRMGIRPVTMDVTDRLQAGVRYLAPERVGGRAPDDPRSDLYSFGCVLFEMLVGRPPFVGGSTMSVVSAHLSDLPLPPQTLQPSIPNELNDLVMRLLEKKPRHRLSHAQDLVSVLGAYCTPPPATSPPPRTYVFPTALFGRRAPLTVLEAELEKVLRRECSLALVGGAHGSGRSRLISDWLEQARKANCAVLIGRCTDGEVVAGGRGLHPLRPLWRELVDLANTGGGLDVAKIFSTDGAALAVYEPTLRSIRSLSTLAEPPALPPAPSQRRLFRSLTSVLERLARRRPLVLILDDVDQADELTLGWLVHLTRARFRKRTGLLVVGLFDTESAAAQNGAIADLRGRANVDTVILDPLTRLQQSEVVASMLGIQDTPPELMDVIERRSRGNPRRVVEFVRSAVATGALRRAVGASWRVQSDDAPLFTADRPMTTAELVAERLPHPSHPAARLLEALAVLSPALDSGALDLLTTSEERDGFIELVRLEMVDDTRELTLTDQCVVDASLARITDVRRSQLHRTIAEYLERAYPDTWLAERARHWEGAGDLERARNSYRRAATRCQARAEQLMAVDLLRCVLRLQGIPTADSVNARVELGLMLSRLSRREEALLQFGQAYTEARLLGRELLEVQALELQAECQLSLGNLDLAQAQSAAARRRASELGLAIEGLQSSRLARMFRKIGNLEKASECAVEAIDFYRREKDRRAVGQALLELAEIRHEQTDYDGARQLLKEALVHLRDAKDRQRGARVTALLALGYQHQGHYQAARREVATALAVQQADNYHRDEGRSLRDLGLLLFRQGQLRDCLGTLEDALTRNRETGDLRSESTTLNHLARAHRDLGDFTLALELDDASLQLARETADRAQLGLTLGNMGFVHQLCGRKPEARALYEEALLAHRSSGGRFAEAMTLTRLGLWHRQWGDLDFARNCFVEALAVCRQVSNRRFEAQCLLSLATLERRRGSLNACIQNLGFCGGVVDQLGAAYLEALVFCERGHTLLAAGIGADKFLSAARHYAAAQRIAAESELGTAIQRLEAARNAHRNGLELRFGEIDSRS